MVTDDFGKRVRELRLQLKLSQEKFALKINMDRTYLAGVESGKRNISLENIKKIADGFEITLEELFQGLWFKIMASYELSNRLNWQTLSSAKALATEEIFRLSLQNALNLVYLEKFLIEHYPKDLVVNILRPVF